MPTTSPDNLWSPDNSDNFEDLVPDLATMQGSVQAALSSRAIRTYKWADTAARTSQTGMSEGDIGYQMDSDVLYRFTGAAWVAGGEATLVGSVAPASGITLVPTTRLVRYGNLVHLTIVATRSSNWTTGAPLGTISNAAWRPVGVNVVMSGFNTSSGNLAGGWVTTAGLVQVYGSTGLPGVNQHQLSATWIVG